MARQTMYCVQTYLKRGGRLVLGERYGFTSASEAEERGAALGRRVAGVLVYAVEDGAEEGEVFASVGEVPCRAA